LPLSSSSSNDCCYVGNLDVFWTRAQAELLSLCKPIGTKYLNCTDIPFTPA
jgi:hypothetical protein